VGHQEGNILQALPQGWDLQRHHMKPIEEFFPKGAGCHQRPERLVGSSHQPYIPLQRLLAAQPIYGPFLDGLE
jgi:hypothetical protein